MGVNIKKLGPNKWLVDVRVIEQKKERRRIRRTVHGSKAKAEETYFQIKQSIKEGTNYLPAKKVSDFKDLLFLYRDKKGGIPEKEKCRFETLLNDLGNVPLKQFPERFEDYYQFLRSSPATGKQLSNATVNRYVATVRAAFNLGIKLGLLEKNPISRYRFPKLKEVPRDRSLSEDEVGRLLNVARLHRPHLYPIMKFALQVPCRRSELINMRREDLDLINNCIRVRNGTTKNLEGIWKPIPPDMVSYFRSLPKETDYLFYREEKGGLKPLNCFRNAWAWCLKQAGIEDLRFHDTRHISATNLIDRGTPERAVMAYAGWKTNMLRTYYNRSGKDLLKLARFEDASNENKPNMASQVQEG